MERGWIDIHVHHPSKDLRFLERALNLPRAHGWVANEPRYMPNGAILDAKPDHYWASGLTFSRERGFKDEIIKLLDLLDRESVNLPDLIKSGGKVMIYLKFQGVINNGDTIDAIYLKKMGDMGIDFSIEVFPKLQKNRT